MRTIQLLKSDRFAPARAAVRGRAIWVSDLRYLPRHLYEVRVRAPGDRHRGSLRLFNIDLHIGPINDFREMTRPMGVDLTDWTISGHAGVIGRHREPIVGLNAHNWRKFSPRVVDRFLVRYGSYLEQFDGFVTTTTPSFAALYLALNKPIIAVCATRYEQPFTAQPELWGWLDDKLRQGVADGQIYLVANNRGDQAYLKHFTGLESTYIPSICSYTHAPYTPQIGRFAVASKSVLCTERIWKQSGGLAAEARELLGSRATWRDRHSVRGWVHIPYNISQMAIFEQYWENVPIYIPDDELLLSLWEQDPEGVLSELSMYPSLGLATDGLPVGDPNRVNDPEVIRWWLEGSDYGRGRELSEIVRFSSFQELATLLSAQDDGALSARMSETNRVRLAAVTAGWEAAIGWLRERV